MEAVEAPEGMAEGLAQENRLEEMEGKLDIEKFLGKLFIRISAAEEEADMAAAVVAADLREEVAEQAGMEEKLRQLL